MRVPSYKNRKPASKKASRTKKRVGRSDTKAEVLLRKELWHRGYRYRKNYGDLPGKPDLAFIGQKVAVFVDGDFWHGRNWEVQRRQIAQRHNSEYWIQKIEYNRTRDKKVKEQLSELGWKVLRLWETDIIQNPEASAERVMKALDE